MQLHINPSALTFSVVVISSNAHVAIDFGQSGKLFALRLGNVEDINGTESVQRPLTLRGCVFIAINKLHRA